MRLTKNKLSQLIFSYLLFLLFSSAFAQPKMRVDGPDADRLGFKEGYPGCPQALIQAKCRVGTWSANHQFAPHTIAASAEIPLELLYEERSVDISYRWGFGSKSIDDFMSDTKTTGLLVIKDGKIIAERYQYDRKPDMPFRSFSMAKTVMSMLIGIANKKGFIKSLDDKAYEYWPEIEQSAYGQTTIKNLLRMSSGVQFKELYTWTTDDDIWQWNLMLYKPENKMKPEKVAEYLNNKTVRAIEQGKKFSYATIETEILGRVLAKASGKSINQLTEEWLWKPMGAEGKAYWLLSGTDQIEGTGGNFNATLRDYGRLGVLLANDGERDGIEVIPKEYILDATDVSRQPSAFHPKVATPFFGYGYQTWLFPLKERTFALQGIHGQSMLVQPKSKIVIVQTSVNDQPSGRFDIRPYQLRDSMWMGFLKSLGGFVD